MIKMLTFGVRFYPHSYVMTDWSLVPVRLWNEDYPNRTAGCSHSTGIIPESYQFFYPDNTLDEHLSGKHGTETVIRGRIPVYCGMIPVCFVVIYRESGLIRVNPQVDAANQV